MSVVRPSHPNEPPEVAAPLRSRRPLRVLLVEDNPDDAELVLRQLRRGGYEPEWELVQTGAALEDALTHGPWDIVLSDYNMPQFDALQALRVLRGRLPLLPFIVISGSIGEETAVAAMRAGANDYVMKTNLPRLLPALERELREAAERTEREQTERAFLELQGKFQAIFHEYLDVMLVLDPAGTILHVNQAARRIMGYDERHLVGRLFSLLWPERQRTVANAILDGVRKEGSAFYSGALRRLDGSACPMDLQASRVPWGHKEGIIVTLRDVTERQRADRRLSDEKEQLAVTLRSMGDGVINTDVFGRVVLLNGEAERLTGWTLAEARGRPFGEVLPLTGGEGKVCDGFLRQVLATGEPVTMSPQARTRDRAGRAYTLAVKAAPIATQEGGYSGVVTVFRDTTAEQKLEEELQKASKLESVALLAGGVAHDFNNILTAILGHLSLAKTAKNPSPQTLASIEKACLYATGLTRQLLTFAKGSHPVRQPENLAELTEESVRFALLGSAMRCCFDLDGDLRPVELDRGQINQVINNLVINAVQASPEGGTLHVTAHNVAVGQEERSATLAPGQYVRLTIRDQGTGIAPENLARIFDPYFTTKTAGTGLGLATSYSIIKKHGGLIRVESEPGVGTAFTMYLPASTRKTPVPKSGVDPQPAMKTQTAARGARILFMDDETILQELVATMLEHLGYEVVCASCGEEAIRRYTEALQAGRQFDVVIVDLTVPGGMGGHEAVRRLRELDPAVRAVVSSGYSNDPLMADYQRHGFSGAIAKPYQMAGLDRALRDVMRLD